MAITTAARAAVGGTGEPWMGAFPRRGAEEGLPPLPRAPGSIGEHPEVPPISGHPFAAPRSPDRSRELGAGAGTGDLPSKLRYPKFSFAFKHFELQKAAVS